MGKQTENLDDSAVVWFVVLERARIDNDFERAAEARAQLERLGVHVKFVHQRPEQKVAVG